MNVHCTRCGGPVAPYASNDYLQDEHPSMSEYGLPVEGSDAKECYACPACGVTWRAWATDNTGRVLACGHFMPLYADWCALCGKRAR